MKYLDFDLEIYPDRIVLDEEINVDKLGWKGGDYFQLVNINGRAMFVKSDPLVKFIKDGAKNGLSQTSS